MPADSDAATGSALARSEDADPEDDKPADPDWTPEEQEQPGDYRLLVDL